ncbi:ester cyclase [Thioclava sp. BHET1]|nr:ester cyclase [Thioclava sp. BHET1]
MTAEDLRGLYHGYIACLNAQDWSQLGRFVAEDVRHNDRPLGLAGYRAMLEGDFRAIPDLRFQIAFLVVEPPHLACRLRFDCHPEGMLFGLPVAGRRVRFDENVFYSFEDRRIRHVQSVIDTAAIAAQI